MNIIRSGHEILESHFLFVRQRGRDGDSVRRHLMICGYGRHRWIGRPRWWRRRRRMRVDGRLCGVQVMIQLGRRESRKSIRRGREFCRVKVLGRTRVETSFGNGSSVLIRGRIPLLGKLDDGTVAPRGFRDLSVVTHDHISTVRAHAVVDVSTGISSVVHVIETDVVT